MRMQKKQFRIGELAKRLNVERFVIRFWEKEFGLKAHRSNGGQRFYEERDFNKFKKIKKLLYEEGFTISGARQQLKSGKKPDGAETLLGSHKTTMERNVSQSAMLDEQMREKLISFKKKLVALRKQL